MRLLYVLILFQLIVFSCSGCLSKKSNQSAKNIKSVDILFGVKSPKNSIQNNIYTHHMGIIYYHEFILIKEYYEDYTTSSTSYRGDTTVVKFEDPVIKHFYYLFDTAKKYFYRIDSLDINVKPRRIELDLDSLYGKKIELNFEKLYSAIKDNLFGIGSVKINKKSKLYIYGPKDKPGATYSDSTLFYYKTDGEYNDIPFSFANELDSMGRGKLYKIEIIYNENQMGTTAYEKMEKITTFEMKKVNETNADTLRLFLNQFKAKYIDIKNK